MSQKPLSTQIPSFSQISTDLYFIEAQGKLSIWNQLLSQLGRTGHVVASNGHVSGFPEDIKDLGMSFEVKEGKKHMREILRQDLASASASIIQALKARDRDGNIYIATDEDAEGDVIAWDICRQILRSDRSLISKVHRLKPRALTPQGLRLAISRAEAVIEHPDDMAISAISGRARAALDRWLGHALSEPGAPAGRVRSGVLGLLAEPSTSLETGEAILRARSANGGPPFIARLSLSQPAQSELLDILSRVGAGFVPGAVRPLVSLGSAAAIRIGRPSPQNTAQAMMTAIRHHGLTGGRAAAGLQSAYLSGMISYPRVDSHEISPASCEAAHQISSYIGIDEFDPSLLAHGSRPDQPEPKLAHEALHPLLGGGADLAKWKELMDLPDDAMPSDRDRMASIVARGTLDAGLPRDLVPGSWDGPSEDGVLSTLEWVQERGPRPRWTRHLESGLRYWPQEAVLIDLMASNGLARPSTYAFHANKLAGSGDIEDGEPGSIPRPSPKGRSAIEGWARDLARPGMNSAIEAVLARLADPRLNASIPDWISRRLAEAFSLLSGPVRERMSAVVATVDILPPLLPDVKTDAVADPLPPAPAVAAKGNTATLPSPELSSLLTRARRGKSGSADPTNPAMAGVPEDIGARTDRLDSEKVLVIEDRAQHQTEIFPSRYDDGPGF